MRILHFIIIDFEENQLTDVILSLDIFIGKYSTILISLYAGWDKSRSTIYRVFFTFYCICMHLLELHLFNFLCRKFLLQPCKIPQTFPEYCGTQYYINSYLHQYQ